MTKQDRAKRYMKSHRWSDAIPILLSDISDNPDDPWSPMYLGSCYYELGDYSEALKYFRCAERLLPGDATPIGLQADALHARGDVIEAGELYQKALATDPTSELAIKNWKRYISIEDTAEPNDAPDDGPATSADNSDASGGGHHR